MEYNVEQLPYGKLHLIKTNKFKKIQVIITFRHEITKNEKTINDVLTNTLIDTSKKYQTSREIEIETEELYDSYIAINSGISGKCNILNAQTIFLNDKYTEKGQFKRAVDLLYELILNPNIESSKFNQKSFIYAKGIVKDNIKAVKDYAPSYSIMRLIEEINPNNPDSYHANLADLKKINPSNLYNHYLNIINNDTIDIFITGDFTKEMINYFKKKFVFKEREYQNHNHYSIEQNICKKLVTKESLPINQSTICLGYVFDDLTEFENRYVSVILNYILGDGSDSLLFNTVREKESLCYSISSGYVSSVHCLRIRSEIDKKNYEKAKKLILEQIEKLKNGDFSNNDIKKSIVCYENGCKTSQNSIVGITNLYRSAYFMKNDDLETRLKLIKKVTKRDIVTLANKMHLSKIFFLEGSK